VKSVGKTHLALIQLPQLLETAGQLRGVEIVLTLEDALNDIVHDPVSLGNGFELGEERP
jgi:hypothetical protein